MSFVHLHVHTEYSLLDGVNKSAYLFQKIKDLNMNSVAISDHGTMYGVPEFWKYSKDFGVKPILGCEIYVSPKERTLRSEVDGIKYYHLLLLAKNKVGYLNLVKLCSIANLEGVYYKPRADRETLKKYSEGLICTSACLAGPIARNILKDREPEAIEWLQFLKETYGDDFYLELQRNGFEKSDDIKEGANLSYADEESLDNVVAQAKVNKKLREYSERFGVPLVATTDAHYLNKEDKEIQSTLFAIKDGKLLTDPGCRQGYEGTYIKSSEEMLNAFSDDITPIENTLKIDEKIESYDIGFGRVQPQFWNVPKGEDAQSILHKKVYNGALKYYLGKDKFENFEIPKEYDEKNLGNYSKDEAQKLLPPELVERIEYELNVIHDKGYDDYFLVVGDLMNWAAANDILMGVRGSAAGSVAAHCLEIVEVDPLKWELYFERFLNPERPSPPDIDMDIQDSRRDEVIDYVRSKYGNDAVAAICTFGKLQTKAAIRDVSRTMGIDLRIADKLSKMVTVVFGKTFPIDKMIETNPEFASIINSDPELQKMKAVVYKITKMMRHLSVHACGHLITPGPIIDYVPLQYEVGGERVITQYEFMWLEELGLMKFDFLGLRTLSIVSDAIKYVKQIKGVDIDFYNIPEYDKETYELFTRGETIGVFQFESPPMQQYLKELRPENQEDLCFMVAAYRPGPMKYIPDYIKRKHGEQEVELLTPELGNIVDKTYGFAIYQEQVIRIAVDLGGYSMGAADILRRAMGKKKMDVMQKEEAIFKEGVKKNGMSEEVAVGLWNYLLPFADYGFNKAHAAGYAVLAYKCAYLKAHYPLEFMTALMHADLGTTDRVVVDIKEAKRLGYKVLQPSINKSELYFAPEGEDGIRFGLGAIKNVGINVCEKIIAERKENGDYAHFDDLITRVGPKNINKRAVESLIKAGAMDDFGDRNALLKIMLQVFENASRDQKSKEIGQTDMFAVVSDDNQTVTVSQTPFPSFDPAPEKLKLEWERELMGIFISSHPLDRFQSLRYTDKFTDANEIDEMPNQKQVKMIALFGSVKFTFTKKDNSKMAIVQLEDMSGHCDAVIFPRTFEQYEKLGLIEEGKAVIITGKVNARDERKSIIIESIDIAGSVIVPDSISIDIRRVTDVEEMARVKSALVDEKTLTEDSKAIEVKIIYGTHGDRKELIRKTDLNNEESMKILRNYIV